MTEYLILNLAPFYLLGAFPTGVLVSKSYGVDITSRGSGNVGATNVARTIGKRAGVLVLLCDVAKGALATIVAHLIGGETFAYWAAVTAVFGHCFSIPPFLKGGKGVATALGVTIALSPIVAAAVLTVFAAALYLTRFVSAGSICAALTAPIAAHLFGLSDGVVFSLTTIALLITQRHRANLARIGRGEEPRFG